MHRLLLFVIALSLPVGACGDAGQVDPPTTKDVPGGVIVHLFEWRWDDIARECEEYLGPNGFAAVQVSPPSENHVVEGRPWWERYQPVSYKLVTRSGDRAAFADMTARCGAVGVDIYVDAVINHMTDADLLLSGEPMTGRGTAGTTFTSFEYPGLYSYDDFNHCGLTDNDDIQDWDNMEQVRNCELVDLADLATGKPHVQQTIADYLKDLRSLGVDGFRIDAAKHTPSEDLAAIMELVGDPGYVYQEVKTGGQQSDWVTAYYPVGPITEFSLGEAIGQFIRDGSMADFGPDGALWSSREFTPSDKAVVFVDNHDNQRGHGGGEGILTYKDGALYDLAQVFTLAWPYGRPRIMSSYAFESDFTGPPMHDDESTQSVFEDGTADCGNGRWVCEHRSPVSKGMVAFYNNVRTAPDVQNWWSDGVDRLAFSRGAQGFVFMNRAGDAWTGTVQTGMPAGTYCNRLAVADDCQEVVVNEEGQAVVTVGAVSAIVIDTGSNVGD